MKSIILILLMITSSVFAQEYPKYLIENNDTIGIIITVKQAQRIDNDLELLKLFEKMKYSSDNTINSYISVVDDMGKREALLQLKIKDLVLVEKTQTSMIDNLNKQIVNYKLDLSMCELQSSKKDTIILNNKSEIKKLKFQKFVGYTFGVTSLCVLVWVIITGR